MPGTAYPISVTVFPGALAAQLIGIEIQPGSPNPQLNPDKTSLTHLVISSTASSTFQSQILICVLLPLLFTSNISP